MIQAEDPAQLQQIELTTIVATTIRPEAIQHLALHHPARTTAAEGAEA